MAERLLTVDGVELCCEQFGDPARPAVLLIAGLTCSMDWWDPELCSILASEGRVVIRYDHRDTGRSVASPVGRPSYSSADLTTDALRILDGLGIDRAHVVGFSAGGAIAQELAAHHPDRLLTLTMMATSPAGTRRDGAPLPPMEPRVAAAFADPPPEPRWDDRAAVVDHLVEVERPYAGSLGFDEERTRRWANVVVDRTRDVAASVTNHWLVIEDDSSVPFRLSDIALPTLVLHGMADPLFPFGHGEALAAEIPNARLVALEGMGHEMPPPELWGVIVPAIAAHTSADAPGSTTRAPQA